MTGFSTACVIATDQSVAHESDLYSHPAFADGRTNLCTANVVVCFEVK